MIIESEHSGLNGLNGGWFKRFWDNFKNTNLEGGGTGGWLGRRLRKMLDSISYGVTSGIELKTSDYEPTGIELLVLNKLKTNLNDYMILLVKNIDSFFATSTNTGDRVAFLNNAIRKIQIVQNYFQENKAPNLSVNAQQYIADELTTMVETFELTIEDMLNENSIQFTKTQGNLVINASDSYPRDMNITKTNTGYGYQYKVSSTTIIDTNAPSQSTGAITNQPAPAVTTNETAGQNTKSSMIVPVVLFFTAVAIALFLPNEKEKK